MVRLRPTSVSGFPHPWLNSRMPCTATHSPLVEPDVRMSRIRLSRRHSPPACARSSWLGLVVQLLSQAREALRQGAAPSLWPAPLPRQVIRRGILGIQAALPSSDSASLRHGPFAPRALPRFPATMGRSDSRPQPRGRLCIPAPASGHPPHWAGSPRFLDRSVGARCPHPPRRVRRVRLPVATSPVLASASLGAWPLSPSVTRPNRVRLRYGSRLRRARLRPPDCSDARSLGYMSTGNSHGDLLSGHKIGQAWPGAPKTAKGHPISENSGDSTVQNFPAPLSYSHL